MTDGWWSLVMSWNHILIDQIQIFIAFRFSFSIQYQYLPFFKWCLFHFHVVLYSTWDFGVHFSSSILSFLSVFIFLLCKIRDLRLAKIPGSFIHFYSSTLVPFFISFKLSVGSFTFVWWYWERVFVYIVYKCTICAPLECLSK